MGHRGYSKYLGSLLFWADILLLNLINIYTSYIGFDSFGFVNNPVWLKYLILLNILWAIINFVNPPYNILANRKLSFKLLIRSFVSNLLIHLIVVLGSVWFTKTDLVDEILTLYVLFLLAAITYRIALLELIKWYRNKGYNFRNVLLVQPKTSNLLSDYLTNHTDLGYKIISTIDIKEIEQVANSNSELYNLIITKSIDEILVYNGAAQINILSALIDLAEDNFIKVRLFNELGAILGRKLNAENIGNYWLFDVSPLPLDLVPNRLLKRMFDLTFTTFLIILVFTWLVPIIALAVILDSGFPVFFKQERSGEKGSSFKCLKFRSMYYNELADIKQSSKNDYRITRVGRILRKYSLDELPQFFNVIKGEMSVVGPRPHMLKHTQDYSKLVNRFYQRHHVKPGITGLAQINGFRGEITSIDEIESRVEYDKKYINDWTLELDLIIIAKTIIQLFRTDSKAY